LNDFTDTLPKTAFVVFNNGAFGGAEKMETNLFLHLCKLFPGKFYYFTNHHLYNQIHEMYDELPEEYIRIIDSKKSTLKEKQIKTETESQSSTPRFYADNYPDPMDVDKQHYLARKIYWFYKNKYKQHKLYRQIEFHRSSLEIKVFYCLFAGVLPLVFYLKEKPRKAAILFSDMDSWFTDVLTDTKKLWYRKYYSFNYALENCDVIDFLSPYVLDGVKKRGLKINQSSAHISPCSFTDYSKCSVADKNNFEIAFCGRLEPDKNPMLYLVAVKKILAKYPKVKFYILGEGTLVYEAKDFIDSNNLSHSIIFQFHKNPPEIFKNTSVFVSLQSGTNYPSQSVLEAMACGNAVIASNRGDTELFINDSNGIIIDLNLDELVTAIEKLIDNPALTHNLGINGRELAINNHTIDKYSEYFLGLVMEAYRKLNG